MIIGICGKAGSGKDTVADLLVKHHGFVKIALADEIKRICAQVWGFSDEQLWGPSSERNKGDHRYPREHSTTVVHAELCDCCGANLWKEASSQSSSQCYLTPRHALQQLGTEWGRSCYSNVWVDLTLRVAGLLLRGSHRYEGGMCGPDYSAEGGLRLLPAVDWIEPAKGIVISDVRFPNEVEVIRKKAGKIWKTSHGAGLSGSAGSHVSESHIDKLVVDYVLPRVELEAVPGEVRRALEEMGR